MAANPAALVESEGQVSGAMEPEPGMVANHEGGFVHQISDMARFRRFLILGSEANCFYASAQDLTLENAQIIINLLAANMGLDMVSEIAAVSLAGRAPRQSPALFALAVILTLAKPESNAEVPDEPKIKHMRRVRKAAAEAIVKVCRTASTLYELLSYFKVLNLDGKPVKESGLGKWNSIMRKAIADWYLNKKPFEVALQVTKYKSRYGISSRDLLRLAHPKTSELGKRGRDEEEVDDMQLALKFAAHMEEEVIGEGRLAEFLRDCQRLKTEKDLNIVITLLEKHRQLSWEHVGESRLLKHPAVWATLLDQGLGLTALIRNLNRFLEIKLIGNACPKKDGTSSEDSYGQREPLQRTLGLWMTEIPGALDPDDESQYEDDSGEKLEVEDEFLWEPSRDYLELIAHRLANKEALVKARVHPLRILFAELTLLKKWKKATIPPTLLSSLDLAFQLSFATAKPTGKKFMLALDVSGSMECDCMGSNVLNCRQATAAIAYILRRIEPRVKVVAFSDGLTPFPISQSDTLESVQKRMENLNFGGTDCSLPILHAIKNEEDVDVFVIMTDSETYNGRKVCKLLKKYRELQAVKGRMDSAKMLVLAFSSTGFSIADPLDPGMLDIAGFDSSIPEIIKDFVSGNLVNSKL